VLKAACRVGVRYSGREVLSRQVSVSASVRGVEAGRKFPVSVKGVTAQAGKVLLLENERAEWELPGGKLELGEDPADCVVREISEEAGWKVTAGPLLDCWQYHIGEGRDVVIVTMAATSPAPIPLSSVTSTSGPSCFIPARCPAWSCQRATSGRSRPGSRA
jgi:8-oxo-dGTP pyrophosphatase MutT (NUDIX family)